MGMERLCRATARRPRQRRKYGGGGSDGGGGGDGSGGGGGGGGLPSIAHQDEVRREVVRDGQYDVVHGVDVLRIAHACVVQTANMGHHLAGGNHSWCPELESRTTHPLSARRC